MCGCAPLIEKGVERVVQDRRNANETASADPVGRAVELAPPNLREGAGHEASPGAQSTEEPNLHAKNGADCLDAKWQGPIGNCLAPSLAIDDVCAGVRYMIHYNDCMKPEALDVKGLESQNRAPFAVTKAPFGVTNMTVAIPAKAIRGRIARSYSLGPAIFDVEIDFEEASGRVTTKHLSSGKPLRASDPP